MANYTHLVLPERKVNITCSLLNGNSPKSRKIFQDPNSSPKASFTFRSDKKPVACSQQQSEHPVCPRNGAQTIKECKTSAKNSSLSTTACFLYSYICDRYTAQVF